jgi:hypothetical protein
VWPEVACEVACEGGSKLVLFSCGGGGDVSSRSRTRPKPPRVLNTPNSELQPLVAGAQPTTARGRRRDPRRRSGEGCGLLLSSAEKTPLPVHMDADGAGMAGESRPRPDSSDTLAIDLAFCSVSPLLRFSSSPIVALLRGRLAVPRCCAPPAPDRPPSISRSLTTLMHSPRRRPLAP